MISVAAVDSSMARASFSQNNEEVDIAAPGAGVLSIVPRGLGSIAVVAVNDQDFQSSFMQNSNLPSTDGVSGYLVNCPKYGTVPCEGTGNHVCLIQR